MNKHYSGYGALIVADHSMSDRSKLEVRGCKRGKPTTNESEPPRKKIKQLLTDDSSMSSDGDSWGGALLASRPHNNHLTVNEDYARRFEHNKRREELQKLEEKYGKRPMDGKPRVSGSDLESATDGSSDSEEEDDEGVLASGNLDEQFQATLKAIQAKDPRVYDKSTTFYTQPEEDEVQEPSTTGNKDKPMFLSDYHRMNILEGMRGADENGSLPSYMQEQNDMKAKIIQEIHANTDGLNRNRERNYDHAGSSEEANDDFLVPKIRRSSEVDIQVRAAAPTAIPNVESADKDPEKYLSDFLSSRVWSSHAGSRFQPFESDDEEEEKRADEFEDAYNLRFEDPNASKEKIVSHARDAAARYSVRREATTARQKARDIERAKREAEKQSREDEKARLRKLRVADAEEKVKKVKDAAGLRQEHINIDDWSRFLDEGWDDKRWEEEMRKSFGDIYYADPDADKDVQSTVKSKAKIKKPKWNDDIDIQDLVPDFDEHGPSTEPQFVLSDMESDRNPATEPGPDDNHSASKEANSKAADRKRTSSEQYDHQKQARKERRYVEQLVEQSLNIDNKLAEMGKKHAGVFRYRETSPIGYGLTAQDILMASDSQLNQYAGLKKLAAFRDSTKKARDRKRLGKKARLRQWRKETFGNELQYSQKTLGEIIAHQGAQSGEKASRETGNVVEGSRRKKRSRLKPGVEES
ncbi:MAG: hypothetical protein Q9170_006102 [Blastenia crenularia]